MRHSSIRAFAWRILAAAAGNDSIMKGARARPCGRVVVHETRESAFGCLMDLQSVIGDVVFKHRVNVREHFSCGRDDCFVVSFVWSEVCIGFAQCFVVVNRDVCCLNQDPSQSCASLFADAAHVAGVT